MLLPCLGKGQNERRLVLKQFIGGVIAIKKIHVIVIVFVQGGLLYTTFHLRIQFNHCRTDSQEIICPF